MNEQGRLNFERTGLRPRRMGEHPTVTLVTLAAVMRPRRPLICPEPMPVPKPVPWGVAAGFGQCHAGNDLARPGFDLRVAPCGIVLDTPAWRGVFTNESRLVGVYRQK